MKKIKIDPDALIDETSRLRKLALNDVTSLAIAACLGAVFALEWVLGQAEFPANRIAEYTDFKPAPKEQE